MWELLQKLEDLGWKPYGKSIAELTETEKNVRLLTSLSSGLWQFVCENDLINHDNSDHMDYWDKNYTRPDNKSDFCTDTYEYQYRLIESALKDESELESFILDNIKIGGNDL